MNVQEIVPGTNGTLLHYFGTSLAFTLLSVWVITAFQSKYKFREGVTFWQRLGWPVFFALRLFHRDPYAPTSTNSVQLEIDQMPVMTMNQGSLR